MGSHYRVFVKTFDIRRLDYCNRSTAADAEAARYRRTMDDKSVFFVSVNTLVIRSQAAELSLRCLIQRIFVFVVMLMLGTVCPREFYYLYIV